VDKGWRKGGQWVEDAYFMEEFSESFPWVFDRLKKDFEGNYFG